LFYEKKGRLKAIVGRQKNENTNFVKNPIINKIFIQK